MFGDNEGVVLSSRRPRRFLSVVDGIQAMEGNGPVAGKCRAAALLIGGDNPVAVDMGCAALMSFDYRRIPSIAMALGEHPLTLMQGGEESVHLLSNEDRWNKPVIEWKAGDGLRFAPHFGWAGHIELS